MILSRSERLVSLRHYSEPWQSGEQGPRATTDRGTWSGADGPGRREGADVRVGLGVVRGRSMEPTLYDGDRLLLLHGVRPRLGRMAVVRLPDGVVAVKRVVRREPDGWWVERDNPAVGVDSWTVGALPDDAVLARVLCRVRPLHRRVRN
jgi:Peptidase S24-like